MKAAKQRWSNDLIRIHATINFKTKWCQCRDSVVLPAPPKLNVHFHVHSFFTLCQKTMFRKWNKIYRFLICLPSDFFRYYVIVTICMENGTSAKSERYFPVDICYKIRPSKYFWHLEVRNQPYIVFVSFWLEDNL